MAKIIIEGPSRLNGVVKVQGAKNSAMKHIFIPLIYEGEYILENIPRIGSTEKHIELIEHFGAKIDWISNNTLHINTKNVNKNKLIPKELLYFTSGGNHIIPIIASRFGTCEIEIEENRTDYGGDKIGSRKFIDIIKTLKLCGISAQDKQTSITFTLESTKAFNFDVPVGSFTATVLAVFSALFKNGISRISNYTQVNEFHDILEFLLKAGANIKITPSYLDIMGPTVLTDATYRNMNDPHDFVTCLVAGLATNSEITIEGIQYQKMRLNTLDDVLKMMNINLDLHQDISTLKPQLENIKPISLFAGQYPLFTTEWQVLFSPLLTQINGDSNIVETFFADRMRHWSELEKLGIKFTFYKDPNYPETNNNPRAVKISGSQQLKGGNVNALDVRTGAALVIAGLIAKGETQISGIENIERGYENLVGRFRQLGADIKIIN